KAPASCTPRVPSPRRLRCSRPAAGTTRPRCSARCTAPSSRAPRSTSTSPTQKQTASPTPGSAAAASGRWTRGCCGSGETSAWTRPAGTSSRRRSARAPSAAASRAATASTAGSCSP
ncbi:unnamed protein product, partial [Ectocarpus fasciculatus]